MSQMRAGRLSIILSGALIALLCLLIGGSIFVASLLLKQSNVATHAQIDADVSADDPSRLQALKQYLATNADGIAQTASLTAGLGQYTQTSIVATISGYADKSGVVISGFDFGTGASTGAVAPTTVTSGNTVTVSLGSPLKYQNFIVFLQLLEQGLMPAQVTSAQISVNSDNPGQINISSLIIKVTG